MTIEELVETFNAAQTVVLKSPSGNLAKADRAGIAAVVRALRGKIGEAHCAGQHYQIGGHPVDVDTSVANCWSLNIIREIIGEQS